MIPAPGEKPKNYSSTNSRRVKDREACACCSPWGGVLKAGNECLLN